MSDNDSGNVTGDDFDSDFDGTIGDGESQTPRTLAGDEWTTRGRTKVRTAFGREFHPSDENLPPITADGVYMTAEQAEAVMAEANGTFGDGHVTIVEDHDTDGE